MTGLDPKTHFPNFMLIRVLTKFSVFSALKLVVNRTMATVSEYGTWKSPISSALATESTVSFHELHVDRAPGKEGINFIMITVFTIMIILNN